MSAKKSKLQTYLADFFEDDVPVILFLTARENQRNFIHELDAGSRIHEMWKYVSKYHVADQLITANLKAVLNSYTFGGVIQVSQRIQ